MKNSPCRALLVTRPVVGTFLAAILGAGSAAAQQKDGNEDLLRFTNGDSLHGTFLGIKEQDLRWRHSEAREAIALRTE